MGDWGGEGALANSRFFIAKRANGVDGTIVVRIKVVDSCEDTGVAEIALNRIERYSQSFEFRRIGSTKRVGCDVLEPGTPSPLLDDCVDGIG